MIGPDFVIIGAMKCGTSTLAAQLGAQPGIFVTTPKEPNFFSDDNIFARGPAWYEALFAQAEPEDVKGEASTHYTKLPTHPRTIARLAETVPAPRLIYLIRDPVGRTISHYIHEWTMGSMSGNFEAALNAHPELVDYGRYGVQISAWVQRFGVEAICLLSLEEMKREPQDVLERACRHIGFAGNPVWQEDLGQMNVSAERIRRLPMHDLLIESSMAKALRRTLVPKSLRARIRQGRQMTVRPEIPEAARLRMERIFATDREILANHFPEAPALIAAYPFLPSERNQET